MTTLARLSLWLPEGRETAFETLFATQCQPLLEKHGMPPPEPKLPDDRPHVDGVSHYVFTMDSPARVAALAEALRRDPDWPTEMPLRTGWTAEAPVPGYYFGLLPGVGQLLGDHRVGRPTRSAVAGRLSGGQPLRRPDLHPLPGGC